MTKPNTQKVIINFLSLVFLAGIVFLFADLAKDSDGIRSFIVNYGYTGLFLVAIISGFNLIVPIPAIAFFPLAVSVGLNSWIVITVITVGMTMGDSIGFFLGRTGRSVIEQDKLPRFIKKIEKYLEGRPNAVPVVVFLYASFVPLPNEALVIPISFIKRPWWHILAPVLAGNAIFNILVAFGFASISGFI